MSMKLKKHLSFYSLRKTLSACFSSIPEHRQTSKVDYSIHDTLMSGFACMHFQDPSLLQFQKRLEKKYHKSNLQTLFGINKIPESTQLRAITNGVISYYLSPFFKEYFHRLQRGKHLLEYQLFPELYLIAIDATDYYSSSSISCSKCLCTKHTKKGNKKIDDDCEGSIDEEEKGVRYSHKALQVAIMHPEMRQVIPLMPEEIRNTDGATKQDCEINAAKRLISKIRKAHPQLGIIMTGDDLYSRQPMIKETVAARMHYIYVAKPDSHKYLTEWLNVYSRLNEIEIADPKKEERHVYRWMNAVPLNGGEEAINVNYISYELFTKNKNGKEIIGYQNSWVTDIEITEHNVRTLVKGGRCKWKIENECFNSLKNQGYCIDHSYGHGENLSFNFYLLTLIAFAFHQVFELTDELFKTCRKQLSSKKNLWDHIRSYLRLFIFERWEQLLKFTLNPEDYLPGHCPAPS